MKFQSIELQNAFNKAKPILENITQIKDTISEEIKSLEKFLQSQQINEDFIFHVKYPSCSESLEFTGDRVITNELLVLWNSEKKRILYQHNQYDANSTGFNSNVSYDSESMYIVLRRPLIETSFEIRKKIYETYLSQFLIGITKKYAVANQKTEDDCPF